MALSAKFLVSRSLERTNAHGLARLVTEKRLYIRILWLLAWLACCAVFLKQFVGFVNKLRDNDVTTNLQAQSVPFNYPDLYFCFDSPLSGSRHLALSKASAKVINDTFKSTATALDALCERLTTSECDYMYDNELAMMSLNSLPYRFLVDQLGHTRQQAIINASITRTGGLLHRYEAVNISEFYHPSNLRCFRTELTDRQRRELASGGSSRSLYFQLMMDTPDSRMGSAELPKLNTPVGNMSAPYWALDKDTLYWPDRWSAARMYITEPGHYPSSSFSTDVLLEAGRTYTVSLSMSEQVHREDPSQCVDSHPDVAVVNPYDNSAYTVAYDYSYCFNRAVQAQAQREINATLAHLPRPWSPDDSNRPPLLYNLSSGWGSVQDVRSYLAGISRLNIEEPARQCQAARRCTQKTYTATANSVLWPSPDSLRSFLLDLDISGDADLTEAPALGYLRSLVANRSELAGEFVRANFLQLQVTVDGARADRTIYTRAYSFESFVADVGGILGVYLGMSVLTVCELAQFLHDLTLLICAGRSRRNGQDIGGPAGGAAEKGTEL